MHGRNYMTMQEGIAKADSAQSVDSRKILNCIDTNGKAKRGTNMPEMHADSW